ncbi:MAG: NUDIX hydrolase [Streptosporangiales bacterium]|nr:NUDIX hydrolase [Streptosporangiales bacterium]
MPQKPADKNAGSIKAAGTVAWRPGPGGAPEILLVHRRRYDDWSLPKGKAEPGEPLPLTAVRETREEGGAQIILGRRLTQVKYKVSGRAKRVTYWSARVTGVADGAVPNEEVDEAVWLPEEEARERVSYPQDADVLDAFAAAPADTVPVILLRHAKAEAKDDWPGEDEARPLNDRGDRDAAAVAPLLACFAPAAGVFTSPALRCTETVRPYAEAAGIRVQRADALRISRTGRSDWSQFLASVLASDRPAILCAHRENLPGLIAAAAAGLGAAGPPAGFDDPLPTAGFWVLHVAAGKLAGADRYDLSEA